MTAKQGLPLWLCRSEPEVKPLVWERHVSQPPPPTSTPGASAVEAVDPAAVEALERVVAAAEDAASIARASAEEARAELEMVKLEQEVLRAEATCARAEVAAFAAKMLADAERELVGLATALAERVIGREVATEPSLIVSWAREALARSAVGEALVIAISVDVAAHIDGAAWGELAARTVVDPSLDEGTCELRGGAAAVTVSAATRLELVAEHVAQESEREAA